MRAFSCVLLCGLTALLPACSRDSKAPTSGTVKVSKEGKIKLAFISNNPADFWTIAQKGTQKAEEDFKDITVEFRMPAQNTAQNQQEIIEDLMTKGVQGIAV